MRLLPIVVCAILCVNCQSRSSTRRSQSESSSAPVDSEGRCQIARREGEAADCYAVRCAEDFIRRNGYTIEPASGPLRPDAFNASQQERRGMLYGSAIVHKWVSTGHFVGFRYRDSSDNVGRAVTMTSSFSDLRLDHLNLVWPPASRLPQCGQDAG
jgi:hypothetical protein